MRKICAVIVTYNRPQLLCRCVDALLRQTYKIDILIYDNHSSMNTKQALCEANLLRDNVYYHYASENSGGAGGFYNGMKMAMKKNYDDLLLMDDDGYAIENDTVMRLVDVRNKLGEMTIVNSLVICDEKTLQLSFSINRSYDGNMIQKAAVDGMLMDFINPFNGTLVSAETVKKIGYPRKEYFVYGDENEYTLRAKSKDIGLCTAVKSLYYHPTNIGNMKKIGSHYVAVSDIPMWKVYCASRNRTHLINQYCGKAAVLKHIIRCYINLLFCKKRFQRLKYTSRGIRDGLHNNFSRELDLSK